MTNRGAQPPPWFRATIGRTSLAIVRLGGQAAAPEPAHDLGGVARPPDDARPMTVADAWAAAHALARAASDDMDGAAQLLADLYQGNDAREIAMVLNELVQLTGAIVRGIAPDGRAAIWDHVAGLGADIEADRQ